MYVVCGMVCGTPGVYGICVLCITVQCVCVSDVWCVVCMCVLYGVCECVCVVCGVYECVWCMCGVCII